jgi:acyl-CoA synthetase (AMP-forming)/AMP-acid ligase II
VRLIEYLDKGASLGAGRPCLTMNGVDLSYGEVQTLSYRLSRALQRDGIAAGDKIAILSSNDPTAFACVFGISRAAGVWCPINPRNEARENRHLLDAFDCRCLIFHSNYAPLVEAILPELPKLRLVVCLDADHALGPSLERWLGDVDDRPFTVDPVDDVAMIAGTGGTTGQPKGVMLSGHNLEVMSAITLMSYPFAPRPNYLAVAPLTHAAGVLCLPVMTLGGRVVIMAKADLAECLRLIARYRITHTFLPPTLIYMLLEHPDLATADLSSLACFWYGAAPISPAKLEEAIRKIGPVMAQLFGQTEAPMMIATLAPADHFAPDGSIARSRLASAGRPAPLVELAIMDERGVLQPSGERGEIVVRGPLVMQGYYKDPQATAEVSRHGWHHTGDIGFLDDDNFLYIVDRAKDMIITGGFNVYSIEVEQALLSHASILDCAVIGLPDEKWGERVTAVVQLRVGENVSAAELQAFVKAQIGSVKAPKQIEMWAELPRSKVGKVLKKEIRATLLAASPSGS